MVHERGSKKQSLDKTSTPEPIGGIKKIFTSITKAYYYFYYKIYKFAELSPASSPDKAATTTISILEILFLAALKFYYGDFHTNDTFILTSLQTVIPSIVVLFTNGYLFMYDNKWKSYIHQFDKLPKDKNLIGTWVVIGIVVFILGNFALSCYLMGLSTGIYK